MCRPNGLHGWEIHLCLEAVQADSQLFTRWLVQDIAKTNECRCYPAFYTLCQRSSGYACADDATLPPGRKYLIVGTSAVSIGDSGDNQQTAGLAPDSAVIANMAVDQRYRKQGIARLLLQACEQHASAAGQDCVSLVVHKKNTSARELYQSSGFREVHPAKPAGLSGLFKSGTRAEHTVMVKQVKTEPSAESM